MLNRHRFFGKAAGLLLALALTGLVGCVPASKLGVAEKQRVDQMAEDIQRLKRELHEAKAPAPAPDYDARFGERLAELGLRVENLDQQVTGLDGKVEELDHAIKNLPKPAPAASKPARMPATRIQAISCSPAARWAGVR